MSAPAHRIHYTYAEYLSLESASNVKHEYLDGQIYGMAGATPEHAALTATVVGLLFPQPVGGRCRAHSSDMRVRVSATGLSTYPDVTVVCGPRELHPDDENAVTNPTLLVEVLSPSTEGYDRGDKFEHYKSMPSLRQYVLVSQRERRVEVWTRGEDGDWQARTTTDGEVARLDAIDCTLDVRTLYEAAQASA
ncbi:MAG: Uma2 family endonuclease [Deltaproteobacteria bacterium]|nr:Uma2 family endonuclease [Deltaproteobacteria bacterium]